MELYEKYQDAIASYVYANKEKILKDHIELCSVPGAKGEPVENGPFGPGPKASLEKACEMYERNGFTVEKHLARGYALATIGTGEKSVGIFCHCDTVDVNGKWEFAEPFKPVVKGEVLVGRGVKDDKGAVTESLYAIKALQEAGAMLDYKVIVFLGSNEESGMVDIMNYVEDNKDSLPHSPWSPTAITSFATVKNPTTESTQSAKESLRTFWISQVPTPPALYADPVM